MGDLRQTAYKSPASLLAGTDGVIEKSLGDADRSSISVSGKTANTPQTASGS